MATVAAAIFGPPQSFIDMSYVMPGDDTDERVSDDFPRSFSSQERVAAMAGILSKSEALADQVDPVSEETAKIAHLFMKSVAPRIG
jgi:hypothetical protein